MDCASLGIIPLNPGAIDDPMVLTAFNALLDIPPLNTPCCVADNADWAAAMGAVAENADVALVRAEDVPMAVPTDIPAADTA
jgi:hypothetical protein